MSEVNLVSIDEIIKMHDQWIELLGGSPGIWATNVLLYAYEVQLSPYYETLFEKAANFGGRITKTAIPCFLISAKLTKFSAD